MSIKKPEDNPLVEKTPYRNDVPPYDLVKTEHFLPALEWAIAEAKSEIEEIKNIKTPTFENVIEVMERAEKGKYLDVVTSVFFHFDGVLATPELEEISVEFKTKLTEYSSDISMDEDLFKQIKAVYDKKDEFNLSDEQKLLLDDSYKGFTRNGALLNDEDKEKLRKNNEKQAGAKNEFSKNVLKSTNNFELYIEDEKELAGLPEGFKTASAEAATAKGQDGKWLLTLQAPSVIPVLTYAENRDLREKIWRGFSTRATTGNEDNKPILIEIVKLRHERAQLLGYDTHADYVLEERMAKTKETVLDMLENYKQTVTSVAKEECKKLAQFADKNDGLKELKPWDMSFYGEKMKQDLYGFDGEELRPYFQFEKTRQGAFDVASKLYDIRFEKADDYPVWNDDVEAFDIYNNKTGELIGVFYTDYFPRETKRGGAWMNDFVTQSRFEDGTRKPPVVGNHGNFTKPTKDKPSLLSMDEVITLFHEFGHGLHGLMSDVQYSSQAGTNVKWDFVELPSQLMENWAKEKEVLDMFAEHFEDGKIMPEDLIKKMKDSENFNAGMGFLRQIQLATLDMMWHTTDPDNIDDVEKFERETCKDFYLTDPEGGLTSASFSHIFAGGYSAGYYSYKWAEILEADAFEAFKENGLFHAETAGKFRKLISSGSSRDEEEAYIEFRGRKADPDALLRREGLLKSQNDNNPKKNNNKKFGK